MHAPRHRFQLEETMARSHQRGTVRLEHKSWVGYLNVKLLDPNTGESKWKKQRVGVLGAKSQMTKYQAYDELERTIAQKTGGITETRADESIVTLGCLPGETARLRQDKEVAANRTSPRRAGERPVAMEAGVYGSLTGGVYLSERASAMERRKTGFIRTVWYGRHF
jgi:hypothetical protein